MPHIELDVNFLSHPKVIRIEPLGQLLFIRSLIYCCQHLTDGILPLQAIPLLSFDLKKFDGTKEREIGQDLVAQLIKEKLWHTHEFGYEINDYLEWQLSKAEVEEMIDKKRKAGKMGGQASVQARLKQVLDQDGSTGEPAGSVLSRSKQGSKTNPASDSDSDSEGVKTKKEEEAAHWSLDDLQQHWNAIPGIKPCKMFGGQLRQKVSRLLKEHPITWWEHLFSEVSKSLFLTGRAKPHDDRKPFRADLDWVTGPINLGKILSGKYDDSTPIRAMPQQTIIHPQEKSDPPPQAVVDRLRRVGIKIPGVTSG